MGREVFLSQKHPLAIAKEGVFNPRQSHFKELQILFNMCDNKQSYHSTHGFLDHLNCILVSNPSVWGYSIHSRLRVPECITMLAKACPRHHSNSYVAHTPTSTPTHPSLRYTIIYSMWLQTNTNTKHKLRFIMLSRHQNESVRCSVLRQNFLLAIIMYHEV